MLSITGIGQCISLLPCSVALQGTAGEEGGNLSTTSFCCCFNFSLFCGYFSFSPVAAKQYNSGEGLRRIAQKFLKGLGGPLSYPMHHAAAGCGEMGRCGKYPLGEGGGGVGGAGRTLGNRSDLPVFLRRLHFANRPRFHCLRFSSISFFTSSLAAQ